MTPPATQPPAVPALDPAQATVARRSIAAMASAGAVALIAFGAGVIANLLAREQNPAVLAQSVPYFALATVVLWGLLCIGNALGALRAWFLALPVGLTSAVLATLLAASANVITSGVQVSAQVFSLVLSSLLGLNLLFIVAAVLAEVFVAPRVAAWVLAHRPRRAARRVAFVRIPASNLDEGELTHLERRPVDQALADEQWDDYCAALVAEGWETVEVDAAPDLPDSVFIEDTVVFFGGLAVLASPGAESRRAEVEAVERAVRAMPGVSIARIAAPGTLDGGDVLKVGSIVYVGASSRTNAEGIRQLRGILSPLGYTVVAVPMTKALHLKSAVTALPDGTIIGDPALIEHTSLFPRFLAVPEPEGVAVVVLSDETLLMSASAPETAALLSGLGYRVVTVDISEFEKLEGCVTCLSVRVR
ncbi:dimethylargininase [Agromyces bracchium]|uniref:Dimethylarginine dimethylaminohydrolase n=1 Tax=Agromyces bracchium TaxID=88376 RepID=A0A6I3M3X4_9MICO|nr:dimethylargininase [Agromyces bracchium]MTH67548.1 dimethylarginine dimethylaminohydrolase [Agromyces bracchium]